jgi:superfamily II DNA/RNA helicase/HKD family nuclease
MTGIIDNREIKLEDVIKSSLLDDGVKKFKVAVGYFFTNGLKMIIPELQKLMERGGEVNVLMGNYVNRKTFEDLVFAFKDVDMARSRQPNNLISREDREEMKRGVNLDFSKQILFTLPTAENEDYLNLLKEWIKQNKFRLKIYARERFHGKAYIFETSKSQSLTRPPIVGVVGSSNLTFSGLRSNTELNASIYTQDAEALLQWFEERWKEADDFSEDLLKVLEGSWISYGPESFPPPYMVYLKTIYELYKESLQTTEEILRTFVVYQDLYDFQKWAVLRAIQIASKYGGVMVSDVVGMGKTYVGLALLEHFYHKNYSRGIRGKILVICPPKLSNMWERMITKYSLHADILSLGMVSKSDYYPELLEKHGNTSTVLIDESHHFRNRGTNRYENVSKFLPLVNEVMLLTATPYAKGPENIYNQVKLFHIEDITKIPITPPNLREFTKKVEKEEASLSELLQYIMVRRTRYDIINQYGGVDQEGREYLDLGEERIYLPKRVLKTQSYSIEDVYGYGFYDEIVRMLMELNYARYALGSKRYLKPQYRKERKYQDLSTMGRNLRGLMKALLLKRLESSIFAFRESLRKLLNSYKKFYELLVEQKILAIGERIDELLREEEDLERILDEIEARRKEEKLEKYDLEAFYIDVLKKDLREDTSRIQHLYSIIDGICEEIGEDYSKDDKLEELVHLLDSLYSGTNEILDGPAEKVIIFSQFIDTIRHLEKGIRWMKEKGYLDKNIKVEIATSETKNIDKVIERFAPKSNQAVGKYPKEQQIDLLIATDLMGEGLNLQDSNIVINYDIHWNPLKLIQRIGRVDRLGTEYEKVYVFNFLPETTLEKNLKIVDKVGRRVQEINKVLGMDAKLLKEDEKPNRSFMQSVYQEEMDKLIDYEREILTGQDAVSTSFNELSRLMEKEPGLLEKVKMQDGIRSAKKWDREHDAVFILCRTGEYTTPYLVEFHDGKGMITTSAQEAILETIKCDREEKPADIDKELFRRRYGEASKLARSRFTEEIKEREKLDKPRRSRAKDYVEKWLRKFSDEIQDIEQKRAISHFRSIIHGVNIEQVLNELRDLEKNNVKGERLFTAVGELISKYNLEEKHKRREEWREKIKEPPHILCGMYLKGLQSALRWKCSFKNLPYLQ